MKRKRTVPAGTKRMKELGHKKIEVWFDPRELHVIQAAAAACGMKLATWIRRQAFHSAEAVAVERRRAEVRAEK